MLTHRMQELLSFIAKYQADNNGVSPTFDEMKDGIGLGSKSGIFRILDELEQRGFIARLSRRPRAIEILRHSALVKSGCVSVPCEVMDQVNVVVFQDTHIDQVAKLSTLLKRHGLDVPRNPITRAA